jgi:hypothetical protein
VKEVTPDQGFMIEKCIQEYQQYILMIGKNRQPEKTDTSRDPFRDNPMFAEMLQYGHEHGWISPDGILLGTQTPGVDLLEVYCSSDSQLTHQCIRQGLKALRFGLREGNLEYLKAVASCMKPSFDTDLVIYGFLLNVRPGVGGINSMQQDHLNLLERSWKLKMRISFTCCFVKPPSLSRAFEAMPSISIWNNQRDPTCFFKTQYRP